MDACLQELRRNSQIKTVVLTSGNTKKVERAEADDILYYLIPGGDAVNGCGKIDVLELKSVLLQEKPDVIHLWGTEGRIGEAIVDLHTDIPLVVTMQGFMYSIHKFYAGGLQKNEYTKMTTFRNIVKRDSVSQKIRRAFKSARREKKILQHSDLVLVSNEWGKAVLKTIAPKAEYEEVLLPINRVFWENNWKDNGNCDLVCTAPYAPFKGLHYLLKALCIVKEQFPTVKLHIPGDFSKRPKSIFEKLKQDGYAKYIFGLIQKHNLSENIVFEGNLSQEDLMNLMLSSQVLCVPSAIENHASTLMEGMLLGMPCVTSDVGGVEDYVVHNQNALKYRYEEYELLAFDICKLLSDEKLRSKLSKNARQTILDMYRDFDIEKQLSEIYCGLLKS